MARRKILDLCVMVRIHARQPSTAWRTRVSNTRSHPRKGRRRRPIHARQPCGILKWHRHPADDVRPSRANARATFSDSAPPVQVCLRCYLRPASAAHRFNPPPFPSFLPLYIPAVTDRRYNLTQPSSLPKGYLRPACAGLRFNPPPSLLPPPPPTPFSNTPTTPASHPHGRNRFLCSRQRDSRGRTCCRSRPKRRRRAILWPT
jgi:hypothetical protein